MNRRTRILTVMCLLVVAGAWLFWPHGSLKTVPPDKEVGASSRASAGTNSTSDQAGSAVASTPKFPTLNTNKLVYRVANTTASIRELEGNPHAILLANAFIDTDKPLDLKIPDHLRVTGDSDVYIVQARNGTGGNFRGTLLAAGAQIVSYIPNNAYLVRLQSKAAAELSGNPLVQAVLPYEPYYKLQSSLLGLAVEQKPLPPGTALNLGLFGSGSAAAAREIEKLGGKVIGYDRSAFGEVLRILPPEKWLPIVQLPVMQFVEPATGRQVANDLSRVTVGISADTVSSLTNDYLGLHGSNVLVVVNDTGVDTNHVDLFPRAAALNYIDGVDTNGHGTHVAGIIASSGAHSTTPVNVGANAEGSITNADFRGKAPFANLFSLRYDNSDYVLQTNAARLKALISNNSWNNGSAEYDLAAASYDAATRDSLPFTTGSQPVLYVFAAGNNGSGNNDGALGAGDTILSPGTAKNVITVGALEQLRNVTNIVTTTTATSTNKVAFWQSQTDSGSQVAAYSSRGNVGIGIEGSFGRFKPDVVSPGTFVVSTRSSQWDTNTYYNPTNIIETDYLLQIVGTNDLKYYSVSVPPTAVKVNIAIFPNKFSPNPFPTDLPIYAKQSAPPGTNAGEYDILTMRNGLTIPPDSGGVITSISAIQGNGFAFAVGNTTNIPVNYTLVVQIFATNNVGDLYQVLQGMNEQLAPYYRYESGTSLAAAGVSGMLALIQDYFTNSLALTPSPALMKALLLNGARSVGGYGLAFTNGINYEGWGLNNIQNSIPAGGLTYQMNAAGASFFVDQNPTNALATGDSHTYKITIDPNTLAQFNQLQATLVWTDPPGDPVAAIKLVNNLDLIITNLDDPSQVYYGNDISPDLGFNVAVNTNRPANLDVINNVESILLPPLLAGNYSVTVIGRNVNVNAVTAQTNNVAGQYAPNVVQDFALVVSITDAGAGLITNAFTVTDVGPGLGFVSNPTGGQNITYIASTNAPLFNQIAGENSPYMGTNNLPLGTNTIYGPNGVVTIGMTNQWHFYIVTNTGPAMDFTNAAFITFSATTLSIPRMGVFEDTIENATRPEGDIDLYVSQDPNITNLSPVTVSNCLRGVTSFGVGNSGASLTQGGTEFVFFTNSVPGQVYYIGVKSEDHQAVEYAFLPIFTDIPFSHLDQNGNQVVSGMLLPTRIPDGNNAHPGATNVFALAILPMQVQKVTVTNLNEHQNFGDLVGTLTFGGQHVVLNNHDGFGNTILTLPRVYDDSRNPPAGTVKADGPGSLVDFRAKSAIGPWILGEVDNSLTQTGQISRFDLVIQPHRDLKQPGVIVAVPPGGWFIDFVDVPAGYTNLTFYATNVTVPVAAPPIQMYEKFGNEPTLTDYDQREDLTNGVPPGNVISIGPPLPQGQYFIGLYNPNTSFSQNVFISATLGINAAVDNIYDYSAGSQQTLIDDAVSGSLFIHIPATNLIASTTVGLVVNSPRIADYTFTLVSPTGQRVLLMENRGGNDTNGAGMTFTMTNIINSTATGGAAANTNYLPVDPLGGVVPITYDFYEVVDQMTVYDTTNAVLFNPGGPDLLFDTGFTNNLFGPVTINVPYPPGISNITIIMNQFGNPSAVNGDRWDYTAGAPVTNYQYLVFTDNTNLANVPIKFAKPPFDFKSQSTNFVFGNLDLATNGDYLAPTNIYDAFGGWTVPTNIVVISTIQTNGQFVLVTNVLLLTNNMVGVISDPSSALTGDNKGSNVLVLANGTITRSIPTTPGRRYNITFWYRGPGIAGWWRGEGNGTDSADPENVGNNGTLIGRFNFPAGEVSQAFQFEDPGNPFQFAATNTYIQVPASPSLNVGAGGGFTIEGWISPTNLLRPQPLFEWLSRVPTNSAITNVIVVQGPVLNPGTGHYYYLLGATNWNESELWATELGGHLVTIDTANEENWVYDTFTAYGTLNRNLWTGLNNASNGITFTWTSGSTNIAYTNWMPGQPLNCSGNDFYVAIASPTNAFPGLWMLQDRFGRMCGVPPTNLNYGVVEVSDIPTNGVQFWISGTNNTPGATNILAGCLYANIVDTNYVSHELVSPRGLLTTNVFQHVALTYNTNSGLAVLYLNGTNVASTNMGMFVPKTDGDLLIGWDMSHYSNNYYGGKMDEMSLYGRTLAHAEISAIYHVSADTTNRLIGKFDPAVTPAAGLAEALVSFGSKTNIIFGVNNRWKQNSYTFTATSNSLPLTIIGVEPGILLDSFGLIEAPETNLYYLPEQALAALNGTSAFGDWNLQVWDNRAGAFVTNVAQLINWQLSLVLESNALISASLPAQTPVTTTASGGQWVYYSVTVPEWAHYATNILVSSTLPVDLWLNETKVPTGNDPNDIQLLNNSTGGIGLPIMATNGVLPANLPLTNGATYYLGVRNSNGRTATVKLEVDYDILALTNGVPFTGLLNTNEYNNVRYFSFDVSSNAFEATFQLLQLSGNADLVIRKGTPLPTLLNSDVGSFSVSNADENIYLLTNSVTNSTPVLLTPGRWFLGVFKRDTGLVQFSVVAKELVLSNGVPTVINLTNGVPFKWTAGPGAALTNFFRFHVTNTLTSTLTNIIQGLRFELYDANGNGDLTLQTNALPLSPPFYHTSQNPGTDPDIIYVYTNSALTNLAADWYLGVPSREVTNLNFTIIAVIQTNLYFPAFPDAQGAGRGALGGRFGDVYHVTTVNDSGPGSLRAAVSKSNRTVIFDVAGTINLASPLVITSTNLTIAGQTSPGGITVAGDLTTLQSVNDVVIRNIRFRPGTTADSFQFVNASNVIADHISASWSANNLVSVLNSSNVTVQWSILADSLYDTNNLNPQSIGSRLRQGSGALTFQHNLYADNFNGNPRLRDNLTLDFVNNVIYNWGIRSALVGGTNDLDLNPDGATNLLNYIGNYLIAGPNTAALSINNYNLTNLAYFGGLTNDHFANWVFQTNNFIDSDTNGILNGANTTWGMFTNDYTRFGRAFPIPPVPVDEAFIAYERVLDFAGVNLLLRDRVDTNIVTKVRYQNGVLISTSPPTFNAGLVAWWRAENNALDSAGQNNGVLQNGAGFSPGEVGTGFQLSARQFVSVVNTPAMDVGGGAGFTIEGWIYPSNSTLPITVAEYENALGGGSGADVGVSLAINNPNRNILLNVTDTNVVGHPVASAANVIQTNTWQHIAATYDITSGQVNLYVNGTNVASQNIGTVRPQTMFSHFTIGARTKGATVANPQQQFRGGIDELSVYDHVLTTNEITAIYAAGSNGKALPFIPLPSYLDTDQDGLPDFWEDTFTTNQLYIPSNRKDRDGDGFTDLEEYNNFLAAPHALTTVTNPVAVDLYQICGQSGHLGFFVTNAVHGFVYLTNVFGSVTNTSTIWSNNYAIFTPTNDIATSTNYTGYGSFSFYVTNLDTAGYFGPVPLSVLVSAVGFVTNRPVIITELTNGVAYTNFCNTNGSDYYHIAVTAFDYAALFEIDNPSGQMALVVRKDLPLPSLSSYDYFTNLPPFPGTEQIFVLTNSTPVPLSPGDWYAAAVNISGSSDCLSYSIKATTLSNILPPSFDAPADGSSTQILETVESAIDCVATDPNSPALPLTFALVSGPAGLTLSNTVIYWTPDETQGPSTNTVEVSVSNGAYTVTNTFNIVVDESNLPPVFVRTNIPNQVVIVPGTFVFTNSATDPDVPLNSLGYTVTNAPSTTNAPTINANGVITWTPTVEDSSTNFVFTTVVTDTNVWAVNTQSFSVTNTFNLYVFSGPGTNIVQPGGINWFAVYVPTNALYASNILIFATLPVNLWFSTNIPPSITNTADRELLLSQLSGISVLSTNVGTAPTNIVPGRIYFLGVENPNLVPVTNAIRVDFALALPPALSLPFIPDQYIAAGDTLVVTNTAIDTNANPVLVYALTNNSPAGAVIDTNGIITWATSTNLAPTNVVITTVVRDTGAGLSATNSFHVIVLPGLIDHEPETNVVNAGSIYWYIVNVPRNADIATNLLLFASSPVNLWFSTNVPPTIVNPTDAELLTNSLAGSHVIYTNTTPFLVPGSRYFLGVQNTNIIAVTNTVEVDFHLLPAPNLFIFSIVQTNQGGTNGYLLTWFAPSGYQFHLQWSPSLAPQTWANFNGVISFTSFISATNSQFQYFDDGSQTGGFGPTRFYRLLLLDSPTNTAPFFLFAPGQLNAAPGVPFVYANLAKDWDVPPQALVYLVTNSLGATNLTINPATGLISWTPDVSLLNQTNIITTTVTDNGVPSKGALNTFSIVVTTNVAAGAAPAFSSISIVTNGMKFQWTAPTNEQFNVRWTTNLVTPVNWHLFPNTITSTNGTFVFVDTNLPFLWMKFYQLILLP